MNMFKKNGGFTLVELIVVIAILAILAGVAVPAYTGYINKANAAADTQVLAAANTALAAAMTENGLAPEAADDYLTASMSGTVVTLSAKDSSNTTAAEILKDFNTYFGNSTSDANKVTFKYYKTLATTPITADGTLAVSE